MEQHSFPTASLANREAFRRSLQSSLSDVLGYLGGGLEPSLPTFEVPVTLPPPSTSSLLGHKPTLSAATPSSLLMQTLGMGRSGLPPRQSSSPFAGQLEPQLNQDILLKHAEKRIAQAQTAVLLQQMAMERRQESLRDALLLRLIQSRRSEGQPEPQGNRTPATMGREVHDSSRTATILNGPTLEEQIKAQKRKQNAYALHALGNHLRTRTDPYIDCLEFEDPNEGMQAQAAKHRRSRGGVSSHFPELLHQMLIDVEDNNQTEIVQFLPHGRAFIVLDMDRFVSEIMPKWFKQSKWNSFARQLNLYGFIRIASGPDAGAFFHDLFLRSRPSLCLHMRRVGVPQANQDRRKCRPKHVADLQEPDFYSMKYSLRAKDDKETT